MKKYNKIILFGLLAVLMSCNDAIDIRQPGRLDATSAFQTVDDLEAGLFGAYALFDITPDISLASNFTDEVSVGAGTGGQGFALYDFVLNAASAAGADFWVRNFTVNNRTTVLLEAAEGLIVEAADQARLNNIIAQTRFIRAYANLEMLTYFSTDPTNDSGLAVPVIDFIPELTIQPMRDTVGDLWAYINDDLMTAESLSTVESDEVFISRDAIKALRARAALTRADYPTALTLATELLGKYPISDRDEYQSMFLDEIFGESIYQLERTRNDNFDGQVNTGSVATGGGWAGSIYTFESIAAPGYFEMDRSLFNAIDPSDIRFDVMVSPASSIDPDYQLDPETSFGTDQLIIAKYPGSEGQPLMNDLKVFRSSEMLFIIAESQVMLNNNFSAAATLIKQLRDARLGADTAMPNFNSVQTALAGILDEKRVEFAFEGHRYRDLKRIGTMANRGVSRDETDCNRQSGACTLAANDFRFTLPIPIVEINANPAIGDQQNPGY